MRKRIYLPPSCRAGDVGADPNGYFVELTEKQVRSLAATLQKTLRELAQHKKELKRR